MAETGVLRPDARVELLDGQIMDMSPIGPFHGGVVGRLARLFNTVSNDRWLVLSQHPVRLDEHSEPQPDVLLLRPIQDDYTNRLPRPDDVYLVVEVSDSTLSLDREDKLPLYGCAGIVEVGGTSFPIAPAGRESLKDAISCPACVAGVIHFGSP